MKLVTSEIRAIISPSTGNPRNSEGAFISLDDGRIAYVYSRYTGTSFDDHARCSLAVIYSYDHGESWDVEHPTTVVDASDYGQINVMSVSLLRMANGDIGLFFLLKLQKDGLRSQYRLRRYKGGFDNLVSDTLCLPDSLPDYYVVNNDRVARLSCGRIIIPAAHHPSCQKPDEADVNFTESRSRACFFVSDDDGMSWRHTSAKLDLNDSFSRTGLQEPGVCELAGGILYGYFRTDRMYQYESVSPDRGEHWFMPQPSRFSSPASPMLVKKNPYNGKFYAVWNPVPEYYGRPKPSGYWIGGRTPLVIASSPDGYNYSEPVIIEDDPTRGFCYPAIHFIDADRMLLAYCSGGADEGGCLNRVTIRGLTITE